METFFGRLRERVSGAGAPLCVGLDPRSDRVPDRFRSKENPILAWNRAIIEATVDVAAAYKPNSAFYEALGRSGWETLKATIEAIPDGIPIILDAKRGDIGSTAEAYAAAIFDELGADAVTLSPYLGRDSVEPFLRRHDKGIFLLCHTSNPGARDLQTLPVCAPGRPPVYQEVARRAVRWNEHRNLGLVVGATYPEALAKVRKIAPEMWFLVPGVGAQGGSVESLGVGLRADGLGILVNVSRGIGLAENPRSAALEYHRKLSSLAPSTSSGAPTPLESLILSLFDIGALKTGDFLLASGQRSNVYIDLRLLVSAPSLLEEAARQYARYVERLKPDLLAGVPYAALPIATAVSLLTGVPMIYPRKEAKQHGLGREIEGTYSPGQRVAVIEDLVTTGGSTLRTVELLRAAGLTVKDVVVLIDREQGAAENLAKAGVQLHAPIRMSEMWDILARHGRSG